jgi:hypothetical protein
VSLASPCSVSKAEASMQRTKSVIPTTVSPARRPKAAARSRSRLPRIYDGRRRTPAARGPVLMVAGTRPEVIESWPRFPGRPIAIRPWRGPVVIHRAALRARTGNAPRLRVECAHRLDAASGDGSRVALQGRIIDRLSNLIAEKAPSLVIVQGDTVSAYAAAVAAFHREFPWPTSRPVCGRTTTWMPTRKKAIAG